VVRHDVEDLPQPDFAKLLGEALVRGCSTKLFVYAAMIDDIVAMRASGGSLEIRRAIDV
jgi:hypothetical protein